MRENDNEDMDTPLTGSVRLCFQDAKKLQTTIARLIRARANKKIADSDYKAIIYGINYWLAFEKHIKELDIEKRLEALEAAAK